MNNFLTKKIENFFRKANIGQGMSETVQYARLLVRVEHMNLLRGKITRNQYNNRISEIVETEYKKLKLRVRILLSKNKFRAVVEVD